MRASFTAQALGILAACLFMLAGLIQPAPSAAIDSRPGGFDYHGEEEEPPHEEEEEETHDELYLYSTEDGGGTVVADFPFDDPIELHDAVCDAGVCTYEADHPGLVSAEPDRPADGLSLIDDAIPMAVEIVDLSDGVAMILGGALIDTPGQFVRLGFTPFHADLIYEVMLPEGAEEEAFLTVKFTSSSPAYTDSADYTFTFTNEEHHGACGDHELSEEEDCDDGDDEWSTGEHCRADCSLVDCADPDDSGATQATDALVTLQTAVGSSSCDLCVCDVDSSGAIAASDALGMLQSATGMPGVMLVCPASPERTEPARTRRPQGARSRGGALLPVSGVARRLIVATMAPRPGASH